MLDHALQLAGRGWRVFPCHTTLSGACSCGQPCGKNAGKHPRIKAWQKDATTDQAQILKWWTKWPDANIGVATGSGLVVTDLDGPAEIEKLRSIAAPHGGLPETLVAQTARGFHIYLGGDWPTTKKVDGLLVRGTGGFVIAPPSLHASGIRYLWAKDVPIAPMPPWFEQWLQTSDNKGITSNTTSALFSEKPAYLNSKKANKNKDSITKRASVGLSETAQTPYEMKRLTSALAAIPASCARDPWLHVGFALHSLHWERSDGTDIGFDLWNTWSASCPEKYSLYDVETRWRSFGKEGRVGITIATLYHIAESHGWIGLVPQAAPAPPPVNGVASAEHVLPEELTSPDSERTLLQLNHKYACIGDMGGKCMVMGWVPSKADPINEIPSFQTFKSFAERFGNQYVMVNKPTKDGGSEEESKQLGAYWLKWRRRRSYDGIDLVPNAPQILPNNALNLWRGFVVPATAGRWPLMQHHIAEVLADGDPAALDYIMRWSAWAVQNPGERAESALVFRGGKGSGKGTFAHALRRMFGAHGLHIANSKHLVGAFNAHLRNCLMLYADEAFWAGDKQGESTLKALITEATLTIEQKGVDAVQWVNRIHLIMTANAEWVVPASHDERRYAMFNVSEKYTNNEKYFEALYNEINSGGLEAMLYDLQNVKLGKWHPRYIVKTQALTEQKMQSMSLLNEWWESLLQEASIPAAPKDSPDLAMAIYLLNHARDFAPRLKELNSTRFGRFLSQHGCIKQHRANGNAWRFPDLPKARTDWEKRYQGWKWEAPIGQWQSKQ